MIVKTPVSLMFLYVFLGTVVGLKTKPNTGGLEPKWVTSNQIEAARRVISRYIKKTGFLWIKIFPDKSVTARAEESRMGSGKGSVKYWVAVVKKDTILFELKDLPKELAIKALTIASSKLPLKTKILIKINENQI